MVWVWKRSQRRMYFDVVTTHSLAKGEPESKKPSGEGGPGFSFDFEDVVQLKKEMTAYVCSCTFREIARRKST